METKNTETRDVYFEDFDDAYAFAESIWKEHKDWVYQTVCQKASDATQLFRVNCYGEIFQDDVTVIERM